MLRGKVILVTGATSGIGQETARLLARHNVKLIITARRKSRLDTLASEIISLGSEAHIVPADVTNISHISHLVQSSIKKFGRIDVLINVAGWGVYKWFEEYTYEEIEEQCKVNFLGLAELTRQVIPFMKNEGSGHIINMCSYSSKIVFPPLTVYSATKYAIEGLTDGLRRELGPWGIHVSRVHPSAVTGTEYSQHSLQRGGVGYTSPSIGRITKKYVAEQLLSLIEYPRPSLFLGRWYDVPVFFNTHFPWLVDQVAFWWVKKLRKI